MKAGFVAAVAALAGGAAANSGHRHAHELFKKGEDSSCTVVTYTTTGPGGLVPSTTMAANTTTSTTSTPVVTVVIPTTTIVPVPTPEAHTCPTAGVYTFSATTITLHETTTVCGAGSAAVPSGTHTVGGVTTVVETATTVVCPVATHTTGSNNVTTATISMTKYVCPSAGTYTIAPTTTTVTEDTTVTFSTPTSYHSGTYSHDVVVTTITDTDTVVYCPFTKSESTTSTSTSTKPTSTSTSTSTSSTSTSTSTSTPPPAPTTTSVAAPSSTVEAPKSSKPKSKPSSGSSSGVSADAGKIAGYAMTFTPYTHDTGDCMSSSDVLEELTQIRAMGAVHVRTYSTDCNTLDNVGSAIAKLGMTWDIGVFLDGSGCTISSSDIKEQVDAIKSYGDFSNVRNVIVGNEVLFNNYCSASELAQLISDVRDTLSGFSGSITTTDVVGALQGEGVADELCPVIDKTCANIHAFFDGSSPASKAGDFVASQIDLLKQICPGNEIIVTETGWPNGGDDNGEAKTGSLEQSQAIQSILEKVNDDVYFMSLKSDSWKGAESSVESHWGNEDPLGQVLELLGL